jgi:hypothetical protein
MNNIYFRNKKITKKRNVPNIWPTEHLAQTPEDFLIGKDIVMYIDPVCVNKDYYKAVFEVIDIERVTRWNTRDGMQYIVMHGYIFGHMDVGNISMTSRTSSEYNYLNMDEFEKNRFWAYRDVGMKLIKEGLKVFTEYFPDQKYKV